MYNLPYFKEKDPAVIRKFMKENPFVILCGCDETHHPIATQIPLLLEEKNDQLILYGHVQRKTDHQLAFEANPNVLAIFTGPHSYVSASWYSNPQTASTWNYMAVHAKGILRFLDDNALIGILKKTTSLFENNLESPSLVEKMPEEYVQKMIKAIIAFEIRVTALDNVFKLSQNRDEKSYHNIIDHLDQQEDPSKQIATEMKERTQQVFKNGNNGNSSI
jgi:transcriptional regulator